MYAKIRTSIMIGPVISQPSMEALLKSTVLDMKFIPTRENGKNGNITIEKVAKNITPHTTKETYLSPFFIPVF